MPKNYSVTPVLRPGKSVYSATFRLASGRRVTQSLRTSNLDQARLICAGLVHLQNSKPKHPIESPPGVIRHAVELYFGESATKPGAIENAIPGAAQGLLQYEEVSAELDLLKAEVLRLQTDLLLEREKRLAIERSVVGQAAIQGGRAPVVAEAFSSFEQHLAVTVSAGYRRQVVSLVRELLDSLPTDVVTIADIQASQISKFLEARASVGAPTMPLTRYSRLREKLARFVNWAAGQYGYRSQMGDVYKIKATRRNRERGDIHWHDLTEVQAVLKTLPNSYWRALVGTLAFAGLQLAELVWLRREDLSWGPCLESATLRVTAVQDPDGGRHYLKTGNRRRTVRVHPRLLAPLLRVHWGELPEGGTVLFPVPSSMRRRARKGTGGGDRWLEGTLSTVLRGHAGGVKRPAVAGLLPRGMNAKSLRRTFGSLLIRSGKSEAEVAAAMGNTPEMVRAHYARILGCEVDVDF